MNSKKSKSIHTHDYRCPSPSLSSAFCYIPPNSNKKTRNTKLHNSLCSIRTTTLHTYSNTNYLLTSINNFHKTILRENIHSNSKYHGIFGSPINIKSGKANKTSSTGFFSDRKSRESTKENWHKTKTKGRNRHNTPTHNDEIFLTPISSSRTTQNFNPQFNRARAETFTEFQDKVKSIRKMKLYHHLQTELYTDKLKEIQNSIDTEELNIFSYLQTKELLDCFMNNYERYEKHLTKVIEILHEKNYDLDAQKRQLVYQIQNLKRKKEHLINQLKNLVETKLFLFKVKNFTNVILGEEEEQVLTQAEKNSLIYDKVVLKRIEEGYSLEVLEKYDKKPTVREKRAPLLSKRTSALIPVSFKSLLKAPSLSITNNFKRLKSKKVDFVNSPVADVSPRKSENKRFPSQIISHREIKQPKLFNSAKEFHSKLNEFEIQLNFLINDYDKNREKNFMLKRTLRAEEDQKEMLLNSEEAKLIKLLSEKLMILKRRNAELKQVHLSKVKESSIVRAVKRKVYEMYLSTNNKFPLIDVSTLKKATVFDYIKALEIGLGNLSNKAQQWKQEFPSRFQEIKAKIDKSNKIKLIHQRKKEHKEYQINKIKTVLEKSTKLFFLPFKKINDKSLVHTIESGTLTKQSQLRKLNMEKAQMNENEDFLSY